ncbi:MAG TPA: PBP1A family penicillin-binding protein [bacterium]|nr:PBP1A family penicillin-binding protein [bacterium]HPL95419.1 PBP1A family penicillin-binding protein [bacterium]
MYRVNSPQSWRKMAEKRKKTALKSYHPTSDRITFKSKKIGAPTGWKKLIRPFLKLALIIIIFGTVSLAGAFIWFSKELPRSTDLLTKAPLSSTKIYDRTGEILLNDVNSNFRRIKINLNDLPEYVKWSAIVAEDRQFYSHHGINFQGILRAIFTNIIKGDVTGQGGSSISQQFVKNALLSPEKTYTRKIKEAILTWQLERRFSKDEILEMYFNEIPYGGTAYGIEAAAQKYFNKAAKDLTLAEAATLAALTQAPSYYSPYGSNKDKLMARKDWILNNLANEGYVSQEKIEEAKKQNLEFSKTSSAVTAPHFVFYIRELIAEKYGEKMLEEGGLKIITTLDIKQQKIAEEAVKNWVEKNKEKYNAGNAALVALNPKTGEITAMVGSANYFDEENDGAVNVAIRPRQPGSSFKPLVYATAFEKGYSPQTILFDLLTTFKATPEDYTPHNYNDHYFGPVSIKKALAGSLNVPAVKTMYLVGVENILNVVEKMNYSTFGDRSRFGLSIVLGGGEVKLLEHTAGYATLAAEGEYHEPLAILKITDQDNNTLEENKPENNRAKKIFEKQTARQITNILSDNNERAYVFGAKNYLTLTDRPVAAKTGTTNDFKDAWTLGYTPSLTTGVWVGNTKGQAMKGSADGSAVAAPIWHEFMENVLAETPKESFNQPENVSLPNKPMLNGQLATPIKILVDKSTGRLATSQTPPEMIEEKNFQEVHNILHYVNKNNPLGGAPTEPWNNDENYTNWEVAVEKWAKENNYGIPPELKSEYEGAHNNENKPTISINAPANEAIITDALNVMVNVFAKRTINKVDYYLDEQKLTSISSAPYNLINFKLAGINNGDYILKAIIYDDVSNSNSAQINIKINLPLSQQSPLNWQKPVEGEIIYEENFPYPLTIKMNNATNYQKLDFYYRASGSNNNQWLGYKEVDDSTIVYTWTNALASGKYFISAVATDKNNNAVKSKEIMIEIK